MLLRHSVSSRLGGIQPRLDAFRERDLLLGGEQRDPADLREIGAHRVGRDGEFGVFAGLPHRLGILFVPDEVLRAGPPGAFACSPSLAGWVVLVRVTRLVAGQLRDAGTSGLIRCTPGWSWIGVPLTVCVGGRFDVEEYLARTPPNFRLTASVVHSRLTLPTDTNGTITTRH